MCFLQHTDKVTCLLSIQLVKKLSINCSLTNSTNSSKIGSKLPLVFENSDWFTHSHGYCDRSKIIHDRWTSLFGKRYRGAEEVTWTNRERDLPEINRSPSSIIREIFSFILTLPRNGGSSMKMIEFLSLDVRNRGLFLNLHLVTSIRFWCKDFRERERSFDR